MSHEGRHFASARTNRQLQTSGSFRRPPPAAWLSQPCPYGTGVTRHERLALSRGPRREATCANWFPPIRRRAPGTTNFFLVWRAQGLASSRQTKMDPASFTPEIRRAILKNFFLRTAQGFTYVAWTGKRLPSRLRFGRRNESLPTATRFGFLLPPPLPKFLT